MTLRDKFLNAFRYNDLRYLLFLYVLWSLIVEWMKFQSWQRLKEALFLEIVALALILPHVWHYWNSLNTLHWQMMISGKKHLSFYYLCLCMNPLYLSPCCSFINPTAQFLPNNHIFTKNQINSLWLKFPCTTVWSMNVLGSHPQRWCMKRAHIHLLGLLLVSQDKSQLSHQQ